MRLRDILDVIQARPISANPNLDTEVKGGFAADLMSDALRYNLRQALLVSGLANLQVVRTAEMVDVAAILMVRDKMPPPETLELAEEVGIPFLGTELTMFEACGRLFAAGLLPCRRWDGQRVKPNPSFEANREPL